MPLILTTPTNPGDADWSDSGTLVGAFTVVDTLTDRDNIATADRSEGMHVYVIAEDTTYVLDTGLANTDWMVQTDSGGARRIENKPGLGTDLYVSPTTGSDINGDGSLANPYATILRAVQDIGLSNESTVNVNLLDGLNTIPRTLDQLNSITIRGPALTVVDTLTIASVTAASDSGGIILNVTGLVGVAADALKDTPVNYTSGAPSGRQGWIYRNDATGDFGVGETRIYVSQDDPSSLDVPIATDTLDRMALGATLSLSSDGTTQIKTSLQCNIEDLIISNPTTTRIFSINDSDKVELIRCSLQTQRGRAGFGGSLFLTNCYVRCEGNAAQGMVVATRTGNIRVANGTVFDGTFAIAGRAFISSDAGGSWTYRGQSVLTEMVDDQLFDGCDWASVVNIAAHHSFLFDPVGGSEPAGFKMNTRGQGGSGGGQLPNMYGETSSDYIVEAQDHFNGELGPSSDIITQFGANLVEVSATAGATNAATNAADATLVGNGFPMALGFSPVFCPLGTVGVPITGATTAAAWQRVLFNPSGGTFLITAPPTPATGDQFGVKNLTTDLTGITVGGNGSSIEDPDALGTVAATTPAFSGAGRSVVWEYNGTDWRVV